MCASPRKTDIAVTRADVFKALVVDSTPLIRLGVTRICDTVDVDVVAEYDDVRSAVQGKAPRRIDYLLLGDIRGTDRINAMRTLRQVFPRARFVWLIDHADSDEIAELINLDAAALLWRSIDGRQLAKCFRALAAGERFIDVAFANAAGTTFEPSREESMHSDAPELTRKELQVLSLLAAGQSNNDLCDKLDITLPTVKTHLAHVYEKLGVNRRNDAVVRALALGLLTT